MNLLSTFQSKNKAHSVSRRTAQTTSEQDKDSGELIDAHWLQRHGEVIFHRCYRILGNRDQAYDAMQEVLTRFLEVQAKRTLAQPLHYLYRMSTNHCLDVLAQSNRTLAMREESQPQTERTQPESTLLVKELIERFGTEDIALLTYRHVDGMTYQELGELHHRSDRAIKKRLDKIESSVRKYASKEIFRSGSTR
jgi:RNA polymerase sigma-70 factor (ECF subfamily)